MSEVVAFVGGVLFGASVLFVVVWVWFARNWRL